MRKPVRKKLKKPLQIGDVLRDALKASKININLDTCKLWDLWDNIVGPAIARNAQPEVLKGNFLIVHVSGAPWMHQLQFMKEELIEQLNKALGKKTISDIRFKVGPL